VDPEVYIFLFFSVISFLQAINSKGNLLNVSVPLSENIKNLFFFEGAGKHKVYLCDTLKKFLYQNYESWCLEKSVCKFSFSSFRQKTKGWLKKGKLRDGVCVYCYLSEDIVKKVEKAGIDSLSAQDRNDYGLYIIHKVCFVFHNFHFV
jgi:hypothetical protein